MTRDKSWKENRIQGTYDPRKILRRQFRCLSEIEIEHEPDREGESEIEPGKETNGEIYREGEAIRKTLILSEIVRDRES